jgi:diacylglycerol kinase (ATP)
MNDTNVGEKWMVIVNPNAGRQKGATDWNYIHNLLTENQIRFDFTWTSHREHAIELTEEFIDKGYRKFIIVGGDGTMNEVLNGIFNQEVIPTNQFLLAVIPIGTGNDWCRMFKIPFNYLEAVQIINEGRTFLQDVGIVTYLNLINSGKRYFMNVAGMGYDAVVASKTNKDKERGRGGAALYLKNLFTSLVFYKFSKTQIKVGNEAETLKNKTFSLSVGICSYNGGGMKQLPFAIADDGLLDMTLIKKLGKFTVIREVKNLYDGSFIKNPKVQTLTSDRFQIESDPPIYLEADGESLGHSPFTFEIIPRSLRVITGSLQV